MLRYIVRMISVRLREWWNPASKGGWYESKDFLKELQELRKKSNY